MTTNRAYADMEPLDVDVVDGRLRITVGTSVLCKAIEWPNDVQQHGVSIVDHKQFVAELVLALSREEEDGTTPVHRMLDKAAVEVLEQGGMGVRLSGE